MKTAWVLIDYQNVHMSAWESFTSYGTEVKDATIHPLGFAKQALKKRTESTGETLDLRRVLFFRGVPNPRKQGRLNSIVTKQHTAWQSDERVIARTRPLRYLRSWPDVAAEEKGIDVLFAVSLVHAVINNDADVFLAATRDTDLLPAIELCQTIRPGSVEIVSWYGQSDLAADDVPNHILGEAAYRASRDPHDYGADVPRRDRRR